MRQYTETVRRAPRVKPTPRHRGKASRTGFLYETERAAILTVLHQKGNNLRKSAEVLGCSLRKLKLRLAEYGKPAQVANRDEVLRALWEMMEGRQ